MPPPIPAAFAVPSDPRRQTANTLHALTDILTTAVCAALGGVDGWAPMVEYGRRKEAFVRRFLTLAHGIPATTPSTGCPGRSPRTPSPSGSGGGWRPPDGRADPIAVGGQAAPDGTSEIGVIPDRLDALDLAGAIGTRDAADCQRRNAGANLAVFPRVAVSLRQRATANGRLHTRRLMAAWDDEFLLQVLNGKPEAHSA